MPTQELPLRRARSPPGGARRKRAYRGLESLQIIDVAGIFHLLYRVKSNFYPSSPMRSGLVGLRAPMTWDIHKLFRRHAQEIVRSLRRRGLSAETAADITQDTFLRVLTSRPQDGTANHNPKAYLFQVSRNLSINYQRRARLLDVVDLDDESTPAIADPSPTPETVVYDRQLLRQTEAALAALPERTRIAFELHRLDGKTINEVAQQLGLSITRTWSLIREAYRHIVLRTGGI